MVPGKRLERVRRGWASTPVEAPTRTRPVLALELASNVVECGLGVGQQPAGALDEGVAHAGG